MPREAAVIGWGYSKLSRDSTNPLGVLAIEACTNALNSTGLSPSDVDGVCTFPNVPYGYPYGDGLKPPRQGIDIVGCGYLVDRMGLDRVRWFGEVSDGMLAGAIVEGIQAIASGNCDVVLLWRAMHFERENYSKFPTVEAGGSAQFAAPYGLVSVIQWHALAYRRYLAKYGKDRSGTAALTVQSRRFAEKNENAFFRGTSLTEDDYFAAREISSPLGLFDCDIPVEGCGAVVLAASSVAEGSGRRIARIAGYAQGSFVSDGRPNFVVEDQIAVGERTTRAALGRAGISIEDVDVAQLYDGFSPTPLYWLEAIGACGRGEAVDFLASGSGDAGGVLPVNTFGGSLSEGRMHGIGHFTEAARQVTGSAGDRQITGASTSIATVGSPGARGGLFVLTA